MMNLLALGLLLSTLAATGFWSSHPDPKPIRLIVVEYDRQPPSDHQPSPPVVADDHNHHHLIQQGKDKLKEATSFIPNIYEGISTLPAAIPSDHQDAREPATLLPNIDQGVSTPPASTADAAVGGGSVKDKICDAYGSCKDKLSTILTKGKDKASLIEDGVSHKLSTFLAKGNNEASEKTTEIEDTMKDASVNISTKAKVVDAASATVANLTDIIHRARDVAYDAAAYAGAKETARASARAAHLVAVAAAYGACIWVTFVSSHALAGVLPRQQFGVVHSRLYPVYFRTVAYAVGAALAAYHFGGEVGGRIQEYNLAAVLGMVLINMVYFEPKATKVMFERMRMEKEEGRGQDMADIGAVATERSAAATEELEAVKSRVVKLSQKLKRLNTYSSVLNMMVLMGLTWHLVHLARCLEVSC